MRKIVYSLLMLLPALGSEAQQLPQFSQYRLNDYVYNPAVAGARPYYEAKSNNRYQWIGITDAPRTYILSVNGPHRNKKIGLGGCLFTDIVGPTRRTGIHFTYAYHMKLNETMKLSLGLNAGLLQFMIDASKITLRDPVDGVIGNQLQTVLLPDFGAGFYLYSEKFYVGVSAPQILQNKIRFADYSYTSLSKLATHVYATAGYKFDIGEDFDLEPSAVMKYVTPAPVQFDLGARVIYQEKVWLGGALRTKDAISAMIGYVYQENLSFGYSYDFTTTNLKNYSTGTHEIMIGIKFNKKPTSTTSSY